MATGDKKETEANDANLKHSQGGVTTRDDVLDIGVPMLQGDPSERVGPEDAIGASPTRGDYRERLGETNYQPHTTERVADAKPGEPTVRVVSQRKNVDKIGEIKGKKGGVDSE